MVKEIWQQLKTCPFCGGKIKPHNSGDFCAYYAICQHRPGCFMINKSNKRKSANITLIPLSKQYIESWNTRY